MTQATLTIASKTFRVGDQASTPRGTGAIVGLDPFGEEEIGVQFSEDSGVLWFSFREVDNPPHLFTCGACGRETAILANGIGPCCFGKDEPMTNDEYDASIRAMLKPIETQPDVARAERMVAEMDIDTYTRIDYHITLLEGGMRLTKRERRGIAYLLRRLRKEKYGSALTHTERQEGQSEFSP